jgi:hypothetical protein
MAGEMHGQAPTLAAPAYREDCTAGFPGAVAGGTGLCSLPDGEYHGHEHPADSDDGFKKRLSSYLIYRLTMNKQRLIIQQFI